MFEFIYTKHQLLEINQQFHLYKLQTPNNVFSK